jgi:LacI family transcriptional regulator
MEWKSDGVLGMLEDKDLQCLINSLERPIPIANCALAREMPGVYTVLGDFAAFARIAIDHLRQLGLRSLALAVLEEGSKVRERLVQPFLDAAKPQNPSQAALVFNADRALLWAPETKVSPVPTPLADWLRGLPKPVGVLCPDLGGGGYIIRCCHALKLRVPDDVAVVGSDDTDLSLACHPTLTSVVLSMETVGFECMRLLAEVLNDFKPPSSTIRLDRADLAVRESTGLRRPEICDIAASLECIRNESTRGLTVEQVMRQTQRVSRVTFHRHFREAVGKTPAQAIRDRKLEEARRLLVGTELPLTMVSDLCGFSSQKVFARAFRATEGTSPRDYRRRHQLAKKANRLRRPG